MDYLEQIRTARECKNYSQETMAEKLNITTGGYSKLERGESKMSVDKLIEIAKVLEIELSDLFLIQGKSPIYAKNNHCSPIQQQYSNYYSAIRARLLISSFGLPEFSGSASVDVSNGLSLFRLPELVKNMANSYSNLLTSYEPDTPVMK